jgi:hypothetical protein
MKKTFFCLCVCLIFGCQNIVNLERPEDYGTSFDDSSYWERVFEGFWNGMNNNYVFWDIDPTDWDQIYRDYRPKFAALDNLDLDEHWDENFQRAKTYFIEMTGELVDGHFSLGLKNGDNVVEIAPFADRYYRRFGADYYDESTWENSGLGKSEIMEAPMLLNTVQNYLPNEDERIGFFNDDFGAAVGKIPLDDGSNDGILYFYFTSFHLLKNLEKNDNDDMLRVWNYFVTNLHAPDIKGVIVDIRGNGGGQVRDLSFLWGKMFSKGKHQIGYNKQKMGDGRLEFSPLMPFYLYGDPEIQRDLEIPLVLLVNNFSISCSETSALFVRSLPNGHLVGGTTWGGQGILTDNSIFNAGQFATLGINLSYTPSMQVLDLNRESFEGKGIAPDYYVPFDYEKFSQGIDTRLEKAIEIISSRR